MSSAQAIKTDLGFVRLAVSLLLTFTECIRSTADLRLWMRAIRPKDNADCRGWVSTPTEAFYT